MIVTMPGPLLPDDSLLVVTAEGRIWQLTAADSWNDFGYPNGNRCLQLANALIPARASAIFLTALDGHLYELDIGTQNFIDHGLPPAPTDAPIQSLPYIAGCIGAPQLDTTVVFPRFLITSSDGRILQYFQDPSSALWEWVDLGCYNNLPFIGSPIATSNGIACVASDGTLTFGVSAAGNFLWLTPSPVVLSGAQITLMVSPDSPVGYFIWFVYNDNLMRTCASPDPAAGTVTWISIQWPTANAMIGFPIADNVNGVPVIYYPAVDGSIVALTDVTGVPPGTSTTVYPAGDPFPFTPLAVAGPKTAAGEHIIYFGLNNGYLMIVGVANPTQLGQAIIAAELPSRIAICLSGGAAQGDFEVGAVTYLYSKGIRPHVLCGTSVGAVNAGKLAEGGPLFYEGLLALEGLINVWTGLQQTSDFYVPEPWVLQVGGLVEALHGLNFGGIEQGLIWSFVNLLVNPAGAILSILPPIASLVNFGEIVSSLFADVESALTPDVTSIFNLNPTRDLIIRNIDLNKIAAAGGALYIAMVQLEDGQLYWMTQSGAFLSGDLPQSLHYGILASASLPVAFPPVFLNGNHYVDGGVRATLPMLPAEELDGPTEYFPINTAAFNPITNAQGAAWSIGSASAFGVTSGLANIALRSVACAVDQTIVDTLNPPPDGFPFAGRLSLIASAVQIHDGYTIDPGLIAIAIDYGFMTAADVFAPSYSDAQACSRLAQQITLLRMKSWQMEGIANGSPSAGIPGQLVGAQGDATWIPTIRNNKTSICNLLAQRLQLHGALPANIYNRAVLSWEKAQWQVPGLGVQYLLAASPWDAYTDTFNNSVQQEPPPQLTTQGRFPGY